MVRASRSFLLAVGVLGAAVAPPRARAQVDIGPQFLVDFESTSSYYNNAVASVASDPGGNFLVVWSQPDPGQVLGRRYDSAGIAQGASFQVSKGAAYTKLPAAASDADGDFAVVWSDYNGANGVHARRVTSTGKRLPAFRVDGAHPGQLPDVSRRPAGDFVVVWNGRPGVFAQRYTKAAQPQGGEFQVSPQDIGWGQPKVAALASGFVVVWQRTDPSPIDIVARRYDQSGTALGPEFMVSQTTTAAFLPDVAALPGGGFVVVWAESGPGVFDPPHGFFRRYDASGQPLDAGVQVFLRANAPSWAQDGAESSQAAGPPWPPTDSLTSLAVASDAAGDFVVVESDTWSDMYGGLGTGYVNGRRFDASGAPASDWFQVNLSYYSQYGAYGSYGTAPADVASAANGDFVVVWGDVWGDVYGRQFVSPDITLLRNDEISALDPAVPPLATIFPLDATAPPPAGDRYLTVFHSGNLDPQVDVLSEPGHPLVFYQIDVQGKPRTLLLIKTADLRVQAFL